MDSNNVEIEDTHTFNDPRVRWNGADNCLYGICYGHGQDTDMAFTTYEHISEISEKVKSAEMHVPKETMVIALSSNATSLKAQIIAALPTCSKKETEFSSQLNSFNIVTIL